MKPHSERFAIWVHIKRKNVSFSSFQNSERIPIMWPVFNQSRSYSSWSRLIQKKPTSIVGQKLISTIKRHKIPHSDTDPGYLLEDINGNVRSSRERAVTDVSQHAQRRWRLMMAIKPRPSEQGSRQTPELMELTLGGVVGGWERIEVRDCGRRMNDRSGASAKRV